MLRISRYLPIETCSLPILFDRCRRIKAESRSIQAITDRKIVSFVTGSRRRKRLNCDGVYIDNSRLAAGETIDSRGIQTDQGSRGVTELDYSALLPDVSQRLNTLMPLTQAATLP